MTLIELMLVLAMVAVLAAMALPMYARYQERVKQSMAIQDITVLQALIKRYAMDSGAYPASLAKVGNGSKMDPWGRPYVYQELISVGSKGKTRKDKKFNPINSDFDLYSRGKDGVTKQQLTDKDSLDDIVRANDGKYVGLAAEYSP